VNQVVSGTVGGVFYAFNQNGIITLGLAGQTLNVAGGIFSGLLSTGQVVTITTSGLNIGTNVGIAIPQYFQTALLNNGITLPAASFLTNALSILKFKMARAIGI